MIIYIPDPNQPNNPWSIYTDGMIPSYYMSCNYNPGEYTEEECYKMAFEAIGLTFKLKPYQEGFNDAWLDITEDELNMLIMHYGVEE